jgi:UrcA family protein
MFKLLAAAGVVLAVLSASPVQAAPLTRVVLVTEAIPYSEADLANDQAATDLLGRIERTARRLCAPASHSPLDTPHRRVVRQCEAKAVDRAVATLAAPLVTAAYARQGRPQQRLAAR